MHGCLLLLPLLLPRLPGCPPAAASEVVHPAAHCCAARGSLPAGRILPKCATSDPATNQCRSRARWWAKRLAP